MCIIRRHDFTTYFFIMFTFPFYVVGVYSLASAPIDAFVVIFFVFWFGFLVMFARCACYTGNCEVVCLNLDNIRSELRGRRRRDASEESVETIEDGLIGDMLWRRRGWLVVLRARERSPNTVETAAAATTTTIAASAASAATAAVSHGWPFRGMFLKRPPKLLTMSSICSKRSRQAHSMCRRDQPRETNLSSQESSLISDEQLRQLVATVVQMDEEGVFREIARCL